MKKLLKKLYHHRYAGFVLNGAYMIGIIVAREYGVMLGYLLISTALLMIIYWKPVYLVMKYGSELYVEYCYKVAEKTFNRFHPWEKRNK